MRIGFFIAGGNRALLEPVEKAEDDKNAAKKIVKKSILSRNDVIIGIAASGNTPFTVSILKECMKHHCLVIAISNNPYGDILNYCKLTKL